MTTQEALREAEAWAKKAARIADETTPERYPQAVAAVSQAYSLLALAYIAEAQA